MGHTNCGMYHCALCFRFFLPKQVSATSIYFESLPYQVDQETGLIDYEVGLFVSLPLLMVAVTVLMVAVLVMAMALLLLLLSALLVLSAMLMFCNGCWCCWLRRC